MEINIDVLCSGVFKGAVNSRISREMEQGPPAIYIYIFYIIVF